LLLLARAQGFVFNASLISFFPKLESLEWHVENLVSEPYVEVYFSVTFSQTNSKTFFKRSNTGPQIAFVNPKNLPILFYS
jgi:hypothetical protein